MKRVHALDNLRWGTVLLVIVYHACYIYNSCGVSTNIGVQGIAQVDVIEHFLYPWFMVFMFVIAGISARFSLQKRTGKAFLKDRAVRILVPSLIGQLTYGWITGWVGMQYAEIPPETPGWVNYLIMFLSGEGPLWFCRLLFAYCVLLLLVRRIDKKERLVQLGERAGLPVLLCGAVPLWLSSFLFNMPMITVYRCGIYGFAFLCGYCVFSHESVREKLHRAWWLIFPACVLGVLVCALYYGENYATYAFLQKPLINLYAWLMVLALLGAGGRFLEFSTPFTAFMTSRSQAYYLLHYTYVSILGYLCAENEAIPFAAKYGIVLIGTFVLLVPTTELLRRIPVVRRLLLGM
ncbi:MAG: acyltransferase [Oscillospiraceae bacterium]|nr:acyltransferase [Oscillospiraceae bacterium]